MTDGFVPFISFLISWYIKIYINWWCSCSFFQFYPCILLPKQGPFVFHYDQLSLKHLQFPLLRCPRRQISRPYLLISLILLIRNYYGQDFYFICYRLVRSFQMKLYDKGNRIKLYQNFILTESFSMKVQPILSQRPMRGKRRMTGKCVVILFF